MPEINLLEAIRQAIDEMMAEDPRIFVFGEDVGKRGGVFRVTEGLYDKYGPMRVIDSPLAESVIVGAAVGAAMNETRPIAEIQFADFIAPAFNQLVQEAARIHYRSNGDWCRADGGPAPPTAAASTAPSTTARASRPSSPISPA
jgi:branched-chain alpha-keto acid dehydrogenase E1 component (EC 1.2.4.4)